MNNKILLVIAAILVLLGLFKPNLSFPVSNNQPRNVQVSVEEPSSQELKDKAQEVVKAMVNGSADRKADGIRLASLYSDMATLIELDGENEVIKSTEEIRQANKLVGPMLKLDIKGKYPDLSSTAENLVVTAIGKDNVLLNKELRSGAVNGFKALAWACNEGSK